ncbi:hypothetical protein [Paludibaculum fermentans]|uniref:hypothetical protein n=1 Tax=Paludibaculum fermentans TaxID=1473598 RepID=UPI003EBF86AE
MFAVLTEVMAAAVAEKVTVLEPAGTVTEAGIVKPGLSSDKATIVPPEGAE